MNQDYLRDLLQRYQQGACTPAEQQAVEQWYESLGQDLELDLPLAEQQTLKATLWEQIAQGTIAEPLTTAAVGWWHWRSAGLRWGALAGLVLGLGWGVWHLNAPSAPREQTLAAVTGQWIEKTNTAAHPINIALTDGSTVALAPTSTLKYPRQFSGAQRQVYLSGEGFFQVAHDARHPFLVYTTQLTTRVLGTSFTVQAYANQPRATVEVKTGRVRVTPRMHTPVTNPTDSASLVVRPNQQAVYSTATPGLHRTLVAQPAVLEQQSFVFDDQPVPTVLTALQKAYGVDIQYDRNDLIACTVHLNLANTSLHEKLDVLCKTLGVSYREEEGRIIIEGRGCRS